MLTEDDIREVNGLLARYRRLRKVKDAENERDMAEMHVIGAALSAYDVRVPYAD